MTLAPTQKVWVGESLSAHPMQEVDEQHRWALDSFSDLLGTMFKANMNLLRVGPSVLHQSQLDTP